MIKHLKEVESRLRAVKPSAPISPWKAEDYIGAGQSNLIFLNIKIPQVRAEFKKGFSFSNQSESEQWVIWDYVWNHSKVFEVMLLSSYWVGSRPVDETFAHRHLVLHWLDRVDNWAHSDELSSHFSKLLEHEPEKLMPVFEKWNRSKKSWFKRQSLVGLLFYARFRTQKPSVKVLLSYIERHINDEHYYVQKGVGWALRESWNVYPVQTLAYLKKNAGRIPPAGWTAATEKLAQKEKQILLKLRRQSRRS